MIIELTIMTLLCIVIGVMSVLLYKCLKKLLMFDELFELFVHDIDTNVTYLNKLTSTSTMSNSPEILAAQQNMKIMSERLEEYVVRWNELTNRSVRLTGEEVAEIQEEIEKASKRPIIV